MSLGLYDPDRRYRRRIWSRIARGGLYLTMLGAASAFAYQIGVEQMRSRQESLEHEAAALRAERVELQQNAIRLEAASRTAEIQYRELLARFPREVPSGEIRALSQPVADRLDPGVPAARTPFFTTAPARGRDMSGRAL